MSTVTKLSPQRNKKRINVYLDGEFRFGIDLDNLVKFGIKVEKEFTEEQIKEIINKAEFQKTYDKLLNFSTFRPRSTKEIKDWFVRKEVSPELHEKLIEKLKKLQLLDDAKFATWWIEQRLVFKNKSKRFLSYELKIKGISQQIIDQSINLANIDEKKLAANLLEKKEHLFKKLDKKQRKMKASQYLARAGYTWSVIQKVLE